MVSESNANGFSVVVGTNLLRLSLTLITKLVLDRLFMWIIRRHLPSFHKLKGRGGTGQEEEKELHRDGWNEKWKQAIKAKIPWRNL